MSEYNNENQKKKEREREKRTLNIEHKWYISVRSIIRSISCFVLFSRLCTCSCSSSLSMSQSVSSVFVIRIAFLWIVYCICYGKTVSFYLFSVCVRLSCLSTCTSTYVFMPTWSQDVYLSFFKRCVQHTWSIWKLSSNPSRRR